MRSVCAPPSCSPRSQVLCIGPTGTGKTLTVSNKLLKYLPLEYISHFLTFSARTSANQTQDLIDSKLDKRQDTPGSFHSHSSAVSSPHLILLLALAEMAPQEPESPTGNLRLPFGSPLPLSGSV